MIQDIYEPLARYRDEFREKFSQLASQTFEELVAKAGIDAEANAATVRKIAELASRIAKLQSQISLIVTLIVLDIIALVGFGVWLWHLSDIGAMDTMPLWAYGLAAAAVAALFYPLFPRYFRLKRSVDVIETQRAEAEAEAWQQLEPLNRLYEWDMGVRMITRVVPRLQFDPFFSTGRLEELQTLFGYSLEMDNEHSVTYAQSGEINGNPFVFGQMNVMRWGTKDYTGSLTIHWTERQRDSKGQTHIVHRSETLHATVTKPCPAYSVEQFLTYGNEAAPNLSFSRRPSELSDDGDGFFARMKRRRAIKKLRKFSQNLKDESQYTMMDNEEFEALFQTTDRDNEVEFRLLFTPLAQQQMLLLLKDRTVGYGDDFLFVKNKKINIINAAHLNRIPLDANPARFRDFDLERARRTFRDFHDEYFRALYFTLAPVLAIPLYQQTRPESKIYHSSQACVWEYESMANFHDPDEFAPPNCRTQCILKTVSLGKDRDGLEDLDVTAYGFRTEPRVDYVSKFGGDGHFHDVPVEWEEYLPVERTTGLRVAKRDEGEEEYRAFQVGQAEAWQEFFRKAHGRPATARFRRRYLSFLPDQN